MNIRNLSLILILLSFSLVSLCQTAELKIIYTAGCNLTVSEKLSNTKYSLASTSKAPNWFSSVFTNIDTSKELTFSLCMNGNDAVGAAGDVSKWEGLWPVYTYGEYLNYNTYIYYTKNIDGYWVSSDPFLVGDAKLAGNGKTPTQNVIPDELAEEFLSKNGQYWSAWAELQDTHTNTGSNTFFMTHQFNSPNVSLAMKYPYCYDYELEYMTRLEKADIPGIKINNIGKSIKDHNLYVIEVSDPNATEEELKDRRVVLIYANEDGNEPDGSWVAEGALNFLVSGSNEAKKILKEVTFLIIPLFDPAGWNDSTYASITDLFKYEDFEDIRPEVIAYTKFVVDWIAVKERNLDVVVNLHNVECNESVNLFCPYKNMLKHNAMSELNNLILSSDFPSYITSNNGTWMEGYSDKRFMDWCDNLWGSVTIPYEINSRYPENRLSLSNLSDLGKGFVFALSDYFKTDSYEYIMPQIEKRKLEQLEKRAQFWNDYPKDENAHIYFTIGAGF